MIDLFSRRVVGWSMQPTMSRDLVMQALLSALWRRRPTGTVLVHSDQGSQSGSQDYLAFLNEHDLEPSMSRRGNCLDNAVAESFFSTLKKLRIRRRIYATRDEARADIFDFIELFYNSQRRHSHVGGVSPQQFEADYFKSLQSVQKTLGISLALIARQLYGPDEVFESNLRLVEHIDRFLVRFQIESITEQVAERVQWILSS